MDLFCRWQEIIDDKTEKVLCIATGTQFLCNYQHYEIKIDSETRQLYIEGCHKFLPIIGLTKKLLEQK